MNLNVSNFYQKLTISPFLLIYVQKVRFAKMLKMRMIKYFFKISIEGYRYEQGLLKELLSHFLATSGGSGGAAKIPFFYLSFNQKKCIIYYLLYLKFYNICIGKDHLLVYR